MHHLSLFAALAIAPLLASAFPYPQGSTGGPFPPFATQTRVTYYQGGVGPAGTVDSSACQLAVGSDTLQADQCYAIMTAALGLQQTTNGTCTYTLYRGSQSCDSVDRIAIPLPAGNGTTCIATGVLDGGKWYRASGVWTCG